MNNQINNILFWGGIITSGTSFLLLIVSILVGKLRAERLKTKLNEEYGKQDQR